MTSPPLSAIGEHIDSVSSWTPERDDPDGMFTYIDLSAVDQNAKVVSGARELACSDAPSRARQLIRAGDVLVSTVRPNLNGVALVPPELDGATASTGFCVLRPRVNQLDARYLYQWVKSPRFVTDMVRKATGASYPAVSDRIVCESKLPLPPLPEQRRIAEILDKADALRAKRRAVLAQLDTLTQSIFLDMFGDPATNPKGWPRFTLRELGTVITGGTPPSAKEGMFDGPIPFVTPGDLESDDPVKRSVTEAGAAEVGTVRPGATLVCCIGATIGKIGRAAVRSAFNQQINAVEWGLSVHDTYGTSVLRFFKPTIIAWGASTTLPILKKSAFERIEIPVPTIELQTEFAERSAEVDRLEQYSRTSHAHCNDLFASLQARAFRGEL
jgi:type I restriction enzyme S subunit